MLNYRGLIEVTKFEPRKHFNGEEWRKALTLKVALKGVPIEVIEKGFIAQLSLIYGDGEVVQLTGVEPLKISREVNNVVVSLGEDVTINGADIDDVVVTALPQRVADLELTIKANGIADSERIASALWAAIGEKIEGTLIERQPEIVERMTESVKKTRKRRASVGDGNGVEVPVAAGAA